MNAITAELVEDGAFFAPVQYGMLETLLVGYDRMRVKIDQVADLFEGDIGSVVHYFVTGNQGDRGGYSLANALRPREGPCCRRHGRSPARSRPARRHGQSEPT